MSAKKELNFNKSLEGKAYRRAWNLRNKERLAARFKRYYAANREKILAYHKSYEVTIVGWKRALGSARERAKKNGLEFGLTSDWAKARWTGNCELTGIPFVRSTGKGGGPGMYSCSLDRIDSKVGYIPDNCRFVLAGINALKGSGTDREMYDLAAQLLAFKASSEAV